MAKLTTLTIEIPYKRAGNIIRQVPTLFDVYQEGDRYWLVPCLDADERRVANLPEELVFFFNDGRPVSERGPKDGNFHVIKDAVTQLQARGMLTANGANER